MSDHILLMRVHVSVALIIIPMRHTASCALRGIEAFESDIGVTGLHEVHQVDVLGHRGLWVRLHYADVMHTTRGNLGDTSVH